MAEHRSTINDVAKRAGVSKSTVSRYLNGKSIREGNYDRIKEAVEYYHFKANPFARLSAKRSNMIGVILPGFDSTVTPRVLTTMDKYLRTKGYTPLFVNTEGDLDFEVRSMDNLERMRMDGIVVVASYLTPAHRTQVAGMHTPVVFLGQVFEGGASVVNDDLAAGEALGLYVAGRGYRKVGCLWVTEADEAVGRRRKEGVRKGLAGGGVTEMPCWEADFTFETAYARAREILSGPDRPEALVCATDRIAYGVYKAARELGLRIPEDIAVAGFGGYDTSELLSPPLTTVRFDVETAACVCADTVLKMCEGEPVSQTQLVGYQFLPGGSV